MTTNPAAAQARLLPFTRSGSYRLRFTYQLLENEAWLNRVLDRAGLRNDPRAQRILRSLEDDGRTRLNEPRSADLPRGVGNIADPARESLQVRATRYAIEQNPDSVREFVNHYEMYTAEYARQRAGLSDRIRARTTELRAAGQSQAQAEAAATSEVLGRPVRGFGQEFNQVVADRVSATAVRQRARDLEAQLQGRVGPVNLGRVDASNAAAVVQARGDHRFATQSSAVYHVNKHQWGELPPEHKRTSFAPDESSQYLRSANETILHGTASVQRNQDGSINVTVTRDYGHNHRLRAIVRIDGAGNAVIATYGAAQ